MGGYYFTEKRFFSKGEALLPTEIAARDRNRRRGPQPIVVKKSKKKKKKIMTNSQKIKAKNNRGNINSINLSFGNMGGGGASGGGGGSSGGSGGVVRGGGGYRDDGTLLRDLSSELEWASLFGTTLALVWSSLIVS